MKQFDIFTWYIFDKKRYNIYQYIIKLGFNEDSSYKETKNSSKSVIEYLTSKNVGTRIFS